MAADFEVEAGAGLAELFEPGRIVGDDPTLLDQFRRDGSPSAFEGLLVRHGGLVRGVCRRTLGDGPDADDAFQATFLILARRAAEVRHPDRLGPWLYGVAARVALKARARRARRREVAIDLARFDQPERTQPAPDLGELLAILDAELARVPAKLRDAVVLCLLEGATVEEAAGRLACPVGTVKSRLARGRAALRARLIRRGVTPALATATLAAPLASADAAVRASVSASLIRATLALALASPASVAPTVAALTRGAAPTMVQRSTALAALVAAGTTLAGPLLYAWVQAPDPQSKSPTATSNTPKPDGPTPEERTTSHMRQIALAFALYRAEKGQSPTVAINAPNGTPLLSWRVALLPYLGQQALYQKFHLDEPWSSDHNRALLVETPDVYQTPDFPAHGNETRFRGFVGPFSLLDPTKPIGVDAVLNTGVNRALFGIARRAVEWTQPAELGFGLDDDPVPPLDRSDEEDHRVAMADASIRLVRGIEPMKITPSRAGDAFIWPEMPVPAAISADLKPVVGPGADRPNPTPPSTPLDFTPIEQRLQRVEDKLDRLIRQLEASTAPSQTKPKP